jgi:hypothetical protein
MRVSELKPGMLLRPKDGYVFVRYSKTDNMHEHLESVRTETVNNRRHAYTLDMARPNKSSNLCV